jgi:hypothetical protein
MSSLFPSFTQFPRNSFNPSQDVAAHAPAQRQRGLLRLFLDALIESRQREAEQQIARLIERSGGKLTDSLEREAERRTAVGR